VTVLVLDAMFVPDSGGWIVRSYGLPGWRPPVKPVLDRAVFERQAKAFQTRDTRFEWREWPQGELTHLGFDRPGNVA
jgi:hypothetical protein